MGRVDHLRSMYLIFISPWPKQPKNHSSGQSRRVSRQGDFACRYLPGGDAIEQILTTLSARGVCKTPQVVPFIIHFFDIGANLLKIFHSPLPRPYSWTTLGEGGARKKFD